MADGHFRGRQVVQAAGRRPPTVASTQLSEESNRQNVPPRPPTAVTPSETAARSNRGTQAQNLELSDGFMGHSALPLIHYMMSGGGSCGGGVGAALKV